MEKYVVIDLETTGHSPSKDDKIIEAGIVVIENNQITDTRATLFNPDKSIPPFIQKLTGISNKDVENVPYFHEKADEILTVFEGSYLIAHNVPFDLGFLNAELANHGKEKLTNPVIDTVELSRILYPKAPSYKLGQLAEYLHIKHNDPHRALSDAYVTAKLFLILKKKLESLPYETIHQLLRLEPNFQSDLYELLYECEQQLAFSIEEREDIISYQGLAFKKLEEINGESGPVHQSFGDHLDAIYEKNGTLENHLKHYEKRDGQRQMSEIIFDSFQSQTHALIEAETGTGKSLAYLIPVIYDAVKSNKRIIISTYTTQLQSQLLEEEIPLIGKITDFPFKAALIKGKSHYINLEKFVHELADQEQDNYDIVLTKAMILVWLTETKTGDIDELHLPSSGYFFFKKVAADVDEYTDGFSSPWFIYSYYQRARNRAQQANIIITNHALLCADMFNDYQYLPSYDKAIIDEAHHFEETASRHNGLKIDNINMQYILNQLGKTTDDKAVGKMLSHYPLYRDNQTTNSWNQRMEQTKYEIDELFQALYLYVVDQKKKSKSLSDIGRIQYRFDAENEDGSKWMNIQEMVTRLTFYIRDLINLLALFEKQFDQDNLEKHDREELGNMMASLQGFIDGLEHLFLLEDIKQQVKWVEIEINNKNNAVYLYSEPADVSELLAESFFDKKDSVILTSATLTMRSSFTFIQDRLGLSEERLVTKKIESPFSYENQVQLLIPNDFPDIKSGNGDDFVYATCEAILSLAQITKGRMLVLFTSYDMLKKSHAILKEIMDLNEFILIGQGITSGSRTRLKKNFQKFDQAILLGTSSFWEGVDIPGEDLSCLVIVKLPFQPPNHPVYEAKATNYKEKGKNPFMELSLPNAVIKFKQGFGRLIRSANDRGIVFVCDARIKTARYGKYFTQSIPNVPIHFDTTGKLIHQADEWF